MSWPDSTIIAPVTAYHRASYAERYSRFLRQVAHLQQHVDGCDHIRTRKDVGDRSDNTGIVGVLPVGGDCHLFHGLSWEPPLVEQGSPHGADGVLVHRDVSCVPCCAHPCHVRQQGSSQTRTPSHIAASSSGTSQVL